MEWAIVAVVLIAVAGVAWYVLRSTPSAADIQGAAPPPDAGRDSSGRVMSSTPGAIARGTNVTTPDLSDPAVRARIAAQADALARATRGMFS